MDASAPPSGCSYEREGDAAFVTLKPALSDVKWDEIESIGNSIESRLKGDQPKKVIFDISPLSYMGSAMVALVVRWWKAVGKYGGKSVVVCEDENVLEVLRLAALDKHWTIVADRETAASTLGIAAGGTASTYRPRMTGEPPLASSNTVQGSGPMLPLIVGGVALPVGIIGAVLFLIQAGDPKLTLGLALLGGLTALIAGVLAAVVCTGTRRTAGIVIAVFGLLIAALAGYRLAPTDAVETEVEAETDLGGEVEELGERVDRGLESAEAGLREAAADARNAAGNVGNEIGETAGEAGRELREAGANIRRQTGDAIREVPVD